MIKCVPHYNWFHCSDSITNRSIMNSSSGPFWNLYSSYLFSYRANKKSLEESKRENRSVSESKKKSSWVSGLLLRKLYILEWFAADSDRHSCCCCCCTNMLLGCVSGAQRLAHSAPCIIFRDVFCSASRSMACRSQHTLQTIEREADVIGEFL